MKDKKKVEIPENALVILVGVAGSGKSTLAKRAFGEDTEIVSSDDCRKEISGDDADQSVTKQAFELFYKKIEDAMMERKRVVADATNLDKFSRENLYKMAEKYDVPVYVLIFNIPLDIIKKQNSSRERVVPEFAIERHFEKLKRLYNEIDKELPAGHVIDIVVGKEEKKEKEI